jgi:hypothetical protein
MYEPHRQPLLSRARFVRRLAWHVACAVLLLAASLALGMAGYQHYEHLPWRDAFENAAMLLGGMGPVDTPHSDAGKVFAGAYALYAGLVFIVTASLILAPVLHRMLHIFHSDERDK